MLEQVAIALTGVVAIYLSQDKREERRKWACIFGLLSQPFWFYAAWKAQQWGMLGLNVLYAYSWFRGFMINWVNRDEKETKATLR
jgi:hypothetical protein